MVKKMVLVSGIVAWALVSFADVKGRAPASDGSLPAGTSVERVEGDPVPTPKPKKTSARDPASSNTGSLSGAQKDSPDGGSVPRKKNRIDTPAPDHADLREDGGDDRDSPERRPAAERVRDRRRG